MGCDDKQPRGAVDGEVNRRRKRLAERLEWREGQQKCRARDCGPHPFYVSQLGARLGILRAAMKTFVAVVLSVAVSSVLSIRAAEPDSPLDIVKVRKNFYMIAGAGGN